MEPTVTPTLAYGYKRGLPAHVACAWGARAIYERNGSLGIVWDRQATIGSKKGVKAIADQLKAGALKAAGVEFKRLHQLGAVRPDLDVELVLFDTLDGLIIKANPQSSGGHLYLVAYIQEPLV